MVITKEIYQTIRSYAGRVVGPKMNQQAAEELTQDVAIRLSLYEGEINSLSSFIFTAVLNGYSNLIIKNKRKNRLNENYTLLTECSIDMDTSEILKQDFDKVMATTLKSHPAKSNIIRLLLNDPEASYADLARENGIDMNTFKANVRWIRQELNAINF